MAVSRLSRAGRTPNGLRPCSWSKQSVRSSLQLTSQGLSASFWRGLHFLRCQSETKFFAENGFHGVCQRTDFSMILNFWHPKPNTRIYNFRHGGAGHGTRRARAQMATSSASSYFASSRARRLYRTGSRRLFAALRASCYGLSINRHRLPNLRGGRTVTYESIRTRPGDGQRRRVSAGVSEDSSAHSHPMA